MIYKIVCTWKNGSITDTTNEDIRASTWCVEDLMKLDEVQSVTIIKKEDTND